MSAAAAPVPDRDAAIQAADVACTRALRELVRTERGTAEADAALEKYLAAVRAYDAACGRPPRQPVKPKIMLTAGIIR